MTHRGLTSWWPIGLLLFLAVGGCVKGPLPPAGEKLFNSGYESYQAGHFQDADKKFSDVIASNPTSWALSEVYYFRGMTRLQLKRRDAAKKDFREGATRDGRPLTQAYSAVALANLEYEEGNDEAAVRLYRQVLDRRLAELPADSVMYRLGISLQRLGRWTEADETFAALINKYPHTTLLADARRRFQASYFTVQIGAFGDRAKAEALAAKVPKEFRPVDLAVVVTDGKTLSTVNAGHYRTFREASAAAAKLQAKGHRTIIRP